MSRSRRVRSSAKWGMLRQARLHQGFGGQAQHDEVYSNTEQDMFRRAQHDEVILNTGWGNETYTFSVNGEKFTEMCDLRVDFCIC